MHFQAPLDTLTHPSITLHEPVPRIYTQLTMKTKMLATLAAIIIGLILIAGFLPFTLVNAGHRAVLTSFGRVRDEVLGEGFHFISPLDGVTKYDIRTQKAEVTADAASRDLQSVDATIAVNFHVNPDTVRALYQETQGDYNSTLIAPAVQESVKAATAQFTADELITKRNEVKDAMKKALSEREGMRYFVVEDVSIVNFSFSESFNEAIENKVRAEQDALAAKNKLEQTKYEAEQKIVSATAEAQAIQIQAEAITQQGGSEYVNLQAVLKWDGKLPTYMLGDTTPFINIK